MRRTITLGRHLFKDVLLAETTASYCEPGVWHIADRVGECSRPAQYSRHLSHLATSTSLRALADQGSSVQTNLIITRSYAVQKGFTVNQKYERPTFELPPAIKQILEDKVANKPKYEDPVIPPPEPKPLTPKSRRAGCIAIKAGMTQEWDEWGVRVPLTVLWIDECQVVGIRDPQRNGYWALQLGAGYQKQKALDPAMAGFYLKQGVPFKREMCEFPVSPDAVLPVGSYISAAHYVPGMRVDVTGYSKYKGFQGVMKRWDFKGLPASHGVSLAHRSPGSIGNRKDPGKVWKGKKMPGHMGSERCMVRNSLVYKVDPARNLVYVRGQVPGPVGDFVYLRDALHTTHEFRQTWNMPFPTFCGELATAAVAVHKSPKDPYKRFHEDVDYFEVEWKKGD